MNHSKSNELNDYHQQHIQVWAFYKEAMKIYEEYGVNFSRNNSDKSKNARLIKESLVKNLQNIFSTTNNVILNSSATFSLNEIIFGLDYSKIKLFIFLLLNIIQVIEQLKKLLKKREAN